MINCFSNVSIHYCVTRTMHIINANQDQNCDINDEDHDYNNTGSCCAANLLLLSLLLLFITTIAKLSYRKTRLQAAIFLN